MAEVKKTAKKTKAIGMSKLAVSVLKKPVVSEKAAQLGTEQVVVFLVHKNANRVAIKQAFKEVYGVTPTRVNVLNSRGKRVRTGRTMGKRSDSKKAMIYLPEGSTVDVFEGV